jgi:hypothetical protein
LKLKLQLKKALLLNQLNKYKTFLLKNLHLLQVFFIFVAWPIKIEVIQNLINQNRGKECDSLLLWL